MTNPLLLFLSRPGRRGGLRAYRPVPVPHEVPSTDALFLLLRRLRTPLFVLVVIFAVSVVGLTLVPGQDADGNVTHLGVFEAFYFMSYTATTIGFGEVVPFTTAQRMWVTFSIYVSVVGWAYAIGTALSLLQDQTVREAVATHRFSSRVRRMREDFVLIAGYGKAGRQVVDELDRQGRRVVVIDDDPRSIDRLASHELLCDVPGLVADASLPAVLGIAGLDHRRCTAVLALTGDDDTNLAVVMAGTLLRPGVPVIARCAHRTVEQRMLDFQASTVINPADRFGAYLVLAMQKPSTYRLVSWLMAGHGADVPDLPEQLGGGTWVVTGSEQFVFEVTRDLRIAGLEHRVVESDAPDLGVADAAGFAVGTDVDTLNLALAEQARRENPDLFVVVRQDSHAHRSLVEALSADAVYSPTDLVANEALARVVTPVFWGFVEHALKQDGAWSEELLDRLVDRCGRASPERRIVKVDRHDAPALERWLRHTPVTLGDLQRHPEDRDGLLDLVPLLLVRGETTVYAPSDDEPVHPGDQLLLVGTTRALREFSQILDYDSAIEYAATGRRIPDGWLWRRLTGVRGRGETRPDARAAL